MRTPREVFFEFFRWFLMDFVVRYCQQSEISIESFTTKSMTIVNMQENKDSRCKIM